MTTGKPLLSARQPAVGVSSRGRLLGWPWAWRWESALAVLALVAAAAAFWVTVNAKFLQYPYWLAVQKADFILGPIFVGLYWRYRRPHNRLGVLLIILGLVGIPYLLESATAPGLYGAGVVSEVPIYALTMTAIIAFPNGRLDGVAERVILAAVWFISAIWLWVVLSAPYYPPAGEISGCRAACPANGLGILSPPSWIVRVSDFNAWAGIAINLATIGLYVSRWATARPPRRRALAIGGPIAVLFVVMQLSFRLWQNLVPNGLSLSAKLATGWLTWTYAASRSFIWYGFLLALVVAELYAGRALRRLVRDSMGRPSLYELEGMLRGPLGDPGLRLGFWRPRSHDWADAEGDVLGPPGAGQTLTKVDRDGRPAAAIVHDKQLSEDPELLQAAGAVALLALENAELDAAWRNSLEELAASRDELADSRARLVDATDTERRKLERDLHDGAQQRLVTIQLGLRLAWEQANGDLAAELEALSAEAGEAVEELRTLAQGIYPTVLRESGLADALRSVAMRAPIPVRVVDSGIGRCSAPVEAAIYFCSLEAVQNSIKHAGSGARVTVTLGRYGEAVHFAVADDGVGMDVAVAVVGVGLVSMRDRIGAVGGDVEVVSSPGQGTTVRGSVPVHPSDRALAQLEDVP